MDDDLKAALVQQALHMEALDDAMLTLRHRLDALTNALGALDRSVHQTHAVSLSVRERVDTLDRTVQRLAAVTLSETSNDNDLPIN